MRENNFLAYIDNPIHGKGLFKVVNISFNSNIVTVRIPKEEVDGLSDDISFFNGEYKLLSYIGKKDIYNNDIYEGSILKDTTGCFKNIIVCYDEETNNYVDQWGCKYIWQTLKEGKFEIIGNKYENLELAEEARNS